MVYQVSVARGSGLLHSPDTALPFEDCDDPLVHILPSDVRVGSRGMSERACSGHIDSTLSDTHSSPLMMIDGCDSWMENVSTNVDEMVLMGVISIQTLLAFPPTAHQM